MQSNDKTTRLSLASAGASTYVCQELSHSIPNGFFPSREILNLNPLVLHTFIIDWGQTPNMATLTFSYQAQGKGGKGGLPNQLGRHKVREIGQKSETFQCVFTSLCSMR